MTLEINALEQTDLPDAFALQKMAFMTEAALYKDFQIPPLRQTFAEFSLEFGVKTWLKATRAGELVGTGRGFERDQTAYLERLAVHPAHRGQGIGSSLMMALEAAFPGVLRFELFTGYLSVDNLRLYTRLGYEVFDERTSDQNIRLICLQKWSVHHDPSRR